MAEKELEKCMNEMDIKRIGDFLLEKRADWIVQKKNPPMASHIPPHPTFLKGGDGLSQNWPKGWDSIFLIRGAIEKRGGMM